MRDRWSWRRFLPLAVAAALVGGPWPGDRGSAAQGEGGSPSSELLLLLSGEIQGNLEPCG